MKCLWCYFLLLVYISETNAFCLGNMSSCWVWHVCGPTIFCETQFCLGRNYLASCIGSVAHASSFCNIILLAVSFLGLISQCWTSLPCIFNSFNVLNTIVVKNLWYVIQYHDRIHFLFLFYGIDMYLILSVSHNTYMIHDTICDAMINDTYTFNYFFVIFKKKWNSRFVF